jgi:hypothetical protein
LRTGAPALPLSGWQQWNFSGDSSLDLAPDFNEFCGLLNAHHVEFVVIGAHALAFHGAPRFTGDLDILIRPTIENARRLLLAISEFGFADVPLTPVQITAPGKIIEMGLPPVQIHVMSQVDGVSWDEVWTGRETASFGSNSVAFIGRDEYLRNKRAAGRLKDLADIEALRDVEND